jgi:hypothetical protein
LVPLDRSNIATPNENRFAFKLKSILCRIFYYSGLGLGNGSLPLELFLARGEAAGLCPSVGVVA